MYRLLEVGEVIENGDEVFGRDHEWFKPVSTVGSVVRVSTQPVRRLVKPAVTPAASSVPEPVVSVGDRVTVLTGPWAGCTGVVIALDAYVLLSDYGKMTAKYDSTPVIKLDHVRVGGHKLILSKVQVEPLPPVATEVLYRDLSHGETVKTGDQFWRFGYGPWTNAGPAEVGDTITGFNVKHRRPVRLQSPGWRYLDAGETVRAGDEGFDWDCRKFSYRPVLSGLVVQNEKLFRRKLPANQGG